MVACDCADFQSRDSLIFAVAVYCDTIIVAVKKCGRVMCLIAIIKPIFLNVDKKHLFLSIPVLFQVVKGVRLSIDAPVTIQITYKCVPSFPGSD